MIKKTYQFYLDLSEPNQSCLLILRDIILNVNDLIVEDLKSNTPCFNFNKQILCYLWVDKSTSEPCILIAEGKKLNLPELEKTTHKKIELLRINPTEDIPLEKINYILHKALEYYK